MLSEVFSEFLDHKISNSSYSPRMQLSYSRHIEVLIDILGDVPINTMSKIQIKTTLKTISAIPKRNRASYKKMSIQEVLAVNPVLQADRLLYKSVEDIKQLMQSLFVNTEDKEVIVESPAGNLRYKSQDAIFLAYAPFDDAEVAAVLADA